MYRCRSPDVQGRRNTKISPSKIAVEQQTEGPLGEHLPSSSTGMRELPLLSAADHPSGTVEEADDLESNLKILDGGERRHLANGTYKTVQ